jgi:hemerythrin-like domain-containing protein
MTNSKIEKTKKEIVQAKAKIAEYQDKLRDLERQKIDLENLEIIAMYRKEKFSEEEFAALLSLQRKTDEIKESENQP